MNFKQVNIASLFNKLNQHEKFETYRALWHEASEYNILTNFPLHLDIELSGGCNLKCASCFQNGLIDGKLGLMDIDLYKNIIDEGLKNGLCAIKLQVRGESFLHPNLFECISYAKEKGILDVQITTNGTLLNKENIQKILDSSLDAIIFSVDSHHEDSCKLKQYLKNYSLVEQSIKTLLENREKHFKSKPWVRLRSSITTCDPQSFNKSKQYLKTKFPKADVYIVGKIHDFRDNEDSYPGLHTNYHLSKCSYLMQRLAIFWNGDVTTCCMDYNNKFQLGNVTSQNIEEIWLSSKMNTFRNIHHENRRKTMAICKHCHACTEIKTDTEIQDNSTRHFMDIAQ